MSDSVTTVLELIPDFQIDWNVRFQERNEDQAGNIAVNAEYTITRPAWEELGSPETVTIVVTAGSTVTDESDEITETEEETPDNDGE